MLLGREPQKNGGFQQIIMIFPQILAVWAKMFPKYHGHRPQGGRPPAPRAGPGRRILGKVGAVAGGRSPRPVRHRPLVLTQD